MGLIELSFGCQQTQLELTPEQKNNFLPNIFESSRKLCKDTWIAPSRVIDATKETTCSCMSCRKAKILTELEKLNVTQTHERHIRGWPWWDSLPAVLMHQSWRTVLRKAKIHNHLIQTFLKPDWPWHCRKTTHFALYFKSSNIVKSKIFKWLIFYKVFAPESPTSQAYSNVRSIGKCYV